MRELQKLQAFLYLQFAGMESGCPIKCKVQIGYTTSEYMSKPDYNRVAFF